MAEASRYESAQEVLSEIFGPNWRQQGGSGGGGGTASEAASDFGRICVEHCYADAWPRPGLDKKTRSLITLSVILTLGIEEEFKLHVGGALNLGHSLDDLQEMLIQMVPYLGVLRAVQGMRLIGQVVAARADA